MQLTNFMRVQIMNKNGLLFTLWLLIFTPFYAVHADQHHGETTSFRPTKLTEKVYLLEGRGGNIAVIKGEQGLVMIDAEYQSMSDALVAELAKFGGAENVVYLLNTHWHGDHTEGNYVLGHHAHIVAHENVRNRLLSPQEIKMFNMVSKAYPKHALPSVTYDKRLSLHINNEHIELVHFANGHTDGDSVVFLKKSNIVHMGDHFFSGFYPFVDLDHGGDVEQLAKNVKTVINMIDDETIVIPGHGPLSSKADLVAFHEMIEGTVAEVKVMLADDMWLEEMQDQGLSEKWAPWADGFLKTGQWIELIYNSLEKNNE